MYQILMENFRKIMVKKYNIYCVDIYFGIYFLYVYIYNT